MKPRLELTVPAAREQAAEEPYRWDPTGQISSAGRAAFTRQGRRLRRGEPVILIPSEFPVDRGGPKILGGCGRADAAHRRVLVNLISKFVLMSYIHVNICYFMFTKCLLLFHQLFAHTIDKAL